MKRSLLIIVVSIVAVMSLAACAGVNQTGVANIRTLGANGSGQVYLVPDVAYINIGIRVDADEVSDALSKNNSQANSIAEALQQLGVDKKDIQTSNFNVYPMMDYGMDGEVTRRYYVVENTVYITVRQLASLGELLDTVVRSGANTINGISFDILDKTAAQAEARDMAIANAKAEAEAIAASAGVKLGNLQSVNVYTSGVSVPMYDAKGIGGAAMESAVPISAGQLKISVEANLVYEIK
ncbi:MAG TPA: SIMPL domain-containing protein [Anaerolineaceae bacterium]|jgi:hypothetical protein|nr:SIMPL domain-containing protein [Anaerolineaceae bacterium]